jgi:nucleotide-binding universal stress UspA family protein
MKEYRLGRKAMLPAKKIVCPTDFSEGSFEAISQASELALQSGAELCLINVLPIQSALPTDPPYAFNIPEYDQALRSEADRRLKELAQQLAAKGLRSRTFIGHGDPAGEIVWFAEQEHADLIVIATHGETGWRRFAFGSVAEKVVRLASCPVLTVRGNTAAALSDVA